MSALLDVLTGKDGGGLYESGADSPLALIGGGIAKAGPLLINPYGSTGSNVGVTLGASLLAGILGGLARSNATEENAAVATALPTFLKADTDTQKAMIDQHPALAKALAAAKLDEVNRAAELEQKRQEAEIARSSAVLQAGQLAPIDVAKAAATEQAKWNVDNSPEAIAAAAQGEAAKAGARERGKYDALKSLYPDSGAGTNLPLDPEQRANAIRGLENTTYERIVNLPAYKQLADIAPNFKSMIDLSKQDTKAADIGLISTIARIRDPNSTVREGEYAINTDVQGYLDRMIGNWRSVVQGESRLTPEDKQKMINSVAPKYNETGRAYLMLRDPLLGALKEQGGNPANVPAMGFEPYDVPTVAAAASREAILAELKRRGAL